MKRYLLAGAALAMLAAPAAARDNSSYFGIEVGPMWLKDFTLDIETDAGDIPIGDVDHSLGVDGDLILGHDFGIIRAELEAGHKWAKHKDYDTDEGVLDADGHSRAYSLMVNAMADLGRDESVNFYVGGGVGIAWVRQSFDVGDEDDIIDDDGFGIRDRKLAWQIIGGVRAPVFRHFDVGVKYRYFNAGSINDEADPFDLGDLDLRGKFRSHSILASLIYNFNAAAAPPPPPPPPPRNPVPDPARGSSLYTHP